MRFWLSLVLGVIILTTLATGLYVGNPDMRGANLPTVTSPANDPAVPVGPKPKAVAEVVEERLDNVAQQKEGTSEFSLTNAGDAPLELTPDKPNCVCAGVDLIYVKDDQPVETLSMSASEGHGWVTKSTGSNQSSLIVPPGGKCRVVIHWDSKLRVGDFYVRVPLHTNDPTNRLIEYKVVLGIKQDVVMTPASFNIGTVDEGFNGETAVSVHSSVVDNLKLSDPSISTKLLAVRIEPLSAEELKKLDAKSGAKLVLRPTGSLPVGNLFERVEVKTNVERMPLVKLEISGLVTGRMSVEPARIDFGVVPRSAGAEKTAEISAKGLAKGETLAVGGFDLGGEHLTANLTNNPEFPTLWQLKVAVKPNAPVGSFHMRLSITDSKGIKRLSIPIRGIVATSP